MGFLSVERMAPVYVSVFTIIMGDMNIVIKTRSLMVMLLLTVAGIITGLVFGACMLDEMWDASSVPLILYNRWNPSMHEFRERMISEHVNDGIRYGAVACFALVVALISGVSALLKVLSSKKIPDSQND